MKKYFLLLVVTVSLMVFSANVSAYEFNESLTPVLSDTFSDLGNDGSGVATGTRSSGLQLYTIGTGNFLANSQSSNKFLEMKGKDIGTNSAFAILYDNTSVGVNEFKFKFKNAADTDELLIRLAGRNEAYTLYTFFQYISFKGGAVNIYRRYDNSTDSPNSVATDIYSYDKSIWNTVRVVTNNKGNGVGLVALYLNDIEMGVWPYNSFAANGTLTNYGFARIYAMSASANLSSVYIDDVSKTKTSDKFTYSNDTRVNNFNASTDVSSITPFSTYSVPYTSLVDDGNGGKCIKITAGYIGYSGTDLTGKKLVSFDFKINTDNRLIFSIGTAKGDGSTGDNSGTLKTAFTIHFYNGNLNYSINGDSEHFAYVWNKIYFSVGEWNNFKFYLDFPNKKGIIYINNVKVGEKSFTTNAAATNFLNPKIISSYMNVDYVANIDNYGIYDASSFLTFANYSDFKFYTNKIVGQKLHIDNIPATIEAVDNYMNVEVRVPDDNTTGNIIIARYEGAKLHKIYGSSVLQNSASNYNVKIASIDISDMPITSNTEFRAFYWQDMTNIKPILKDKKLLTQ